MQRWARWARNLFNCEVTLSGEIPKQGLCVSNHVSYIDIIVLSSQFPCGFVSKHEVRYWPIFGMLASMGGTLFIRRSRKGHVADIGKQMDLALKAPVPLVVFPEGTSSNGDAVLPFKSSLFEPAIRFQWPVTPIWVGYEIEDGTVEDDVAYWRDMTLVPHLINLFSKKGFRATIRFGKPLSVATDRKQLCSSAFEAVVALQKNTG